MALFDSNAPKGNVRPMTAGGDKAPAQKWANLGMTVPIRQDDGTVVDTFVTALGIPLDNVQMPEFRGSSAVYQQIVQAKRAIIAAILAAAEKADPGTESPLHGLEVQVRKVGENAEPEVTPEAASVLDMIAARLAGKAA